MKVSSLSVRELPSAHCHGNKWIRELLLCLTEKENELFLKEQSEAMDMDCLQRCGAKRLPGKIKWPAINNLKTWPATEERDAVYLAALEEYYALTAPSAKSDTKFRQLLFSTGISQSEACRLPLPNKFPCRLGSNWCSLRTHLAAAPPDYHLFRSRHNFLHLNFEAFWGCKKPQR